MTADEALVLALGGTRLIAAPDPIASDYLLLGLRLDQHIPGLVDSYYGPADLKSRADMEQRRAPARLLEDIATLAERVEREVDASDRRDWFLAQLRALAAHADALRGEPLPYVTYVERCLGYPPRRHTDNDLDRAAASIDDFLPGDAPIPDRLDAFDRRIEIPAASIPAVSEFLLDRFRQRARRDLGLPPGETVDLTTVRDQPWMAYHRYLGGGRSTVELTVDLPVSAHDLVVTLGHEVYPGHHLEATWREADLLERHGRLEVSMILAATPESSVSEGLARYGTRFASPLDERADLLVEVLERAGSPVPADRGAARDVAERAVRLAGPRERLEVATDEAALRLHVDGASRTDVLTYLREVGRYRDTVAAKRLAFIDGPLARLYVFAYETGEALVAAWVETAEAPDQVGRFGRLLHEQVTPGRLLAESR